MVNVGMQPREALREVEARLTAAGCPDADFDAGEPVSYTHLRAHETL